MGLFFHAKLNSRVERLVERVISDSKEIYDTFQIKGYTVGATQREVECVWLALTIFLESGFVNQNDLSLKLVPAYQKKIMANVSRQEYEKLTQLIQDTYLKYREKAIKIQFSGDSWAEILLFEFAKQTADYLNVVFCPESQQTLLSFLMAIIEEIMKDKDKKY